MTDTSRRAVPASVHPTCVGDAMHLEQFAHTEAVQSLLGTARLNGPDPTAWLRDMLEELPIWLNSQIDSRSPLDVCTPNDLERSSGPCQSCHASLLRQNTDFYLPTIQACIAPSVALSSTICSRKQSERMLSASFFLNVWVSFGPSSNECPRTSSPRRT